MFTLNEVHVRRNFIQACRLHDEMEVVGHQTVGIEFDAELLARFAQQDEKRRVINWFWKDDALVVSAIHDVEYRSGRHFTVPSRHTVLH